jgi:hypothetical protein
MSIDRPDFDAITEDDLLELESAQVAEGLRIEYKRELYGTSDPDRKEAVKDISAFANSAGGHLIIGVEEAEGIPKGIPGIDAVDPDEIVRRLEQLARDGIEPRIQGLRARSIRLSSGRYCFLIRVPRSWSPPHRVSTRNSNRYWIRNSTGCHEASMDELRHLFGQHGDAARRALDFRDQRIAEILSEQSGKPLAGDGRLFVHIIPLASVISRFFINLEAVERFSRLFRPIGSEGDRPRFNLRGFIYERGGIRNLGYTQVFRNGVVEATNAGIVNRSDNSVKIAGLKLEGHLIESIPSYVGALQSLGVPAPLVILLTIEGAKGATYTVRSNHFDDEPGPPLDNDLVRLPDCYVNDYGTHDDYCRALRPAFDCLWNSSGYPKALSFDESGRWNWGA